MRRPVLVRVAGVVAAAIALVAAGTSAIATDRSDPTADPPEIAPLAPTRGPDLRGLPEEGSSGSEPVRIPVITPSPPGPVPMPLVQPVQPGPVPMPHVQLSPPGATVLPVPPKR